MENQVFMNKVRSAQQLGLDVNQNYEKVNGSIFAILTISKGDVEIERMTMPIEENVVVEKLKDEMKNVDERKIEIERQLKALQYFKENK